MPVFDYTKNEIYQYQETRRPDNAAICFLGKIFLLEQLFAEGVHALENEVFLEVIPSDYEHLVNLIVEQKVIRDSSTKRTMKKMIDIATIRDKINHLNQFYLDLGRSSFVNKEADPSKAELVIRFEMEQFLCISEINKENRFEIYQEKVKHFFHKDIIKHVYELLDTLRGNSAFHPQQIESYNIIHNIIPSNLTEVLSVADFSLKKNTFIFGYLLEHLLKKNINMILEQTGSLYGDIEIIIDTESREIKLLHYKEIECDILHTENNYLISDLKGFKIKHTIKFPLDNFEPERIRLMTNLLWGYLQGDNGDLSITELPETAEQIFQNLIIDIQKNLISLKLTKENNLSKEESRL